MSVFKFGTLKSPPRRPTVQGSEQSPFCTSPSQLQEVTLDPGSSGNGAIPFTLGLRSPGKNSPIRGHTVKEYEDQLTQLKKENFNLKLRIYFLDERMGQMNRVDDEDHTKENIELKVECESLRKEVADKQELLCQAAKALDVLEEQHHSELNKLKQEHAIEKGILDSHIQELEKEVKILKEQAKEQKFINLKSTGDIHSQEETEQLKQQIADLTSQVETMKLQQKYRSDVSREQFAASQLQRKSSSTQTSTAEEKCSPGRRTHINSDVSVKEKQSKTMEEWKKEDPLKCEASQLQIKELESQLTVAANKLRESEELLKKKTCQYKKIDEERIKAYQAIKGFMKRSKDLNCELEQLKLEMKKRDHHIHDLTSELKVLRDACNKANWEADQLQAQASVQGSCGKPGTCEDVRDMTEEENERLWAELEDKKKKLAEVTTQRDNISTEMAKQVQNLLTALWDKKSSLRECEKRYAASSSELETKNKHIKDLNEELIAVKKKLSAIEKDLQEKSIAETQDKKDSEEKQKKIESLEVELEDKKKEVEHLNIELGKRNGNLQELLNKELWDKNKEIEHLRDGSEKKEMEVMLLQQKLNARDFQLQLLQEKVTELGIQVSLPTSLVLKELQQHQQVGTYFAQHMHMAGDADHNLHDQLHASWEDRKYLCQKVEELREKLRNTPERDSDSRALRTECSRLREELEKADGWRRDATDVCFKLTQRLEELSMFLAALLKHPEQLNALSVKRRFMLRQAVERSMEMSRSLSVTLSVTNQDFSETTLPLLKDSISSIFVASDLNISELLKESSDVEITGINEEKLAFEMHVEGNNNTENLGVKILKHAELVNNLQLQVEAQQQEMKQDNKEKEVLQKIASKISLVSADSVQKSETEDNNSLSSMTFYNSKIVGSGCGGNAVVLSEDRGPGSSSVSESDIQPSNPFTASCQTLRLEMQPLVPGSDIELTKRFTASCQIFRLETPPKLSVPKKGTKARGVNKMRRSSSASAVPLSQVVPAVSKKEQGVVGSLSDSEAWSEPDRSVSLARIGLSEEGTNTVVSPGAYMDVGVSCCRKIIQMEDNSSDSSSEETTREITRTPGKRARSEAAEIKQLQNRLQSLEHLNEVLKAELSIMHQLTPHGNKSVLVCNQNMSVVSAVGVDNSANVFKSPSEDVSTNANPSVSINEVEAKESKHKVDVQDKSTNTSPVMNKSNMESSTSTEKPVAVPLDLLDQIKFQREKLESSLHHNNLIRYHLEKVFVSLSSKQDDVASEACRRIRETAEQLEEVRHKCLRQEYHIKELNLQLEQSSKQTKQTSEELQVTQNAVRSYKEHVKNLEALLKEHESKLSDQQCLVNETNSTWKEKSLELDKMMQEKRKLREEYAKKLQEVQKLKKESDARLQKARKIEEDAKIKLAEMEIELRDYKILVESHKLEKVETLKFQENTKIKIAQMEVELSDYKLLVERQHLENATLQKEKEENLKKFEIMLREVRNQIDDVEFRNREVRKQMQVAELQKLEAERMILEVQQKSETYKEECKNHVEKIIEEQKKDLEVQLELRVREEQQKLADLHKKELEAKIKEREKEIGKKADGKIKELEDQHKKIVTDLKQEIQEKENCVYAKEIELKKKLDEAILFNSKITLEKIRVANEKLHLEKELRKQEALKCDLLQERKAAENTLSVLKKKMVKELSSVHQLNKDKMRLEKIVKDLEIINDELLKRICVPESANLDGGNQGDTISGGESTPSKAVSSSSPRSISSGLEVGSTGPVSLETNISLGDDQDFGNARQQSEASDDISYDHILEGYNALFSQLGKSEVEDRCIWLTEIHSAASSSNARNLTSPDLGIESDQGRFSSLEASSSALPEIHPTGAADNLTEDGIGAKDYKQLQSENIMLKQRLYRTRRALEQTAVQLSEANRRKKEVEKAICKQLHKTHLILKYTRQNLEVKPKEAEKNTK